MENLSRNILISNDTLLADIRSMFNLLYPFLIIEFSTNGKGIFLFKKHKPNGEKSVSKIANLPQPVKIDVNDERTVAELEKDFIDLLGLKIKVYRKSGNVWNEISLTDNWTLKNQNKAGKFISTEMAAAS